jgi:hypothetical protein
MKSELRKILRNEALGNYTRNAEGDFVPLDWSGTPDAYFDNAIDAILELFNKEQTEIHVTLTVGKNKSNVYINGEFVFRLGHDKEMTLDGNVKLLADIKSRIQ